MLKISTQTLPKHQLELTIEVPTEDLENYLSKAAVKLSQEKPPAGFRPGKVDKEAALRVYGPMALYEASLDFVVRDTLPKAIQDSKVEFVGQPDVSVIKCAPDNPIIYKAILSLRPTITLGDYKKLELKRKEVSVSKEQAESVLDELCESRAKETAAARFVQKGDRIKADINMFLDNVPLDGGQAKGQSFIIGKHDIWQGFSENLIGIDVGGEKEFSLDISKDHPQKNIAGKKVDFKIKIHEVFERRLPKMDDEFAKSLGNFDNLEALKEVIADNLKKEAEIKEQQRLEGEVLQKIVQVSDFSEMPELIIINEQNLMLAETKDMVKRQGLKWEDYLSHIKKNEDELLRGFQEPAQDRIKKNLILMELAKQKDIKVTDEEVENEWQTAQKYNPEMAELEQKDKTRAEAIKNHIKVVLKNRKVLKELLKELTS